MPYTIGVDCDLLLIHPDVDDGYPFGFVLAPDPSNNGSAISIQRELDEASNIHIYIFFTVIIADELKNPDGSMHAVDRLTMYLKLLQYIDKADNLTIQTFLGSFLGIGPLGHASTELHLVNGSYISCKLTNITAYHPPIDPELFFASMWQDDEPAEGALTWETSVWR